MFCSKCGLTNLETARFCAKCGMGLVSQPSASAASVLAYASGAGTVREPASSDKLASEAKNPTVATVLSLFIIGLGQLYNADVKKGLVMFFAAVVLGIPTAGVAIFVFWIWSGLDAYKVASRQWKRW